MHLSKRQKAAIIVRLLLAEGAQISLAGLPEGLQAELTHQMGNMRFVDRETLRAVIGEFTEEIDAIGLSFPGGLEGALSVLDGTISAATASRLRKQAGIVFRGDPWDTLCALEPERLLPVLERESVEVAAVLLSKLKVSKAAELLGRMPGERARRITYAVSQTSGIAPGTVRKIGLSLMTELDAQPVQAFDSEPSERVGAILNFSPTATREDVLAGLDQTDSGFAEQVRKAIFTFANIPSRIDPRDVPKIVRAVDQQVLVTVLAGARGEIAAATEFVLSNMSQRMAQTIRDEVGERGIVKDREVEEACTAVVVSIRELEAAGEISLVAEEE